MKPESSNGRHWYPLTQETARDLLGMKFSGEGWMAREIAFLQSIRDPLKPEAGGVPVRPCGPGRGKSRRVFFDYHEFERRQDLITELEQHELERVAAAALEALS